MDILLIIPGALHQQILCLFCFNGNGIVVQSNKAKCLDESSENTQKSPFVLEPKVGTALPFLGLQEVDVMLTPSVVIRLMTSSEESTSS